MFAEDEHIGMRFGIQVYHVISIISGSQTYLVFLLKQVQLSKHRVNIEYKLLST